MPSRPTHPDASQSGIGGGSPDPRPNSRAPPWAIPASSTIEMAMLGVPLTWADPSTSSMSSGAASRASAARCLSWSAISVDAATTARPLLNIVWLPAEPGVVRRRRRVLIDDGEVLGLHAQDLGGKDRHGHDCARTVFLSARDDGARAVAVELDVGT